MILSFFWKMVVFFYDINWFSQSWKFSFLNFLLKKVFHLTFFWWKEKMKTPEEQEINFTGFLAGDFLSLNSSSLGNELQSVQIFFKVSFSIFTINRIALEKYQTIRNHFTVFMETQWRQNLKIYWISKIMIKIMPLSTPKIDEFDWLMVWHLGEKNISKFWADL